MNSPETESAARRRRILEAFDQTLDLSVTDREAYLQAQFADDDDAIRTVLALIEADEVAPSVMPTELATASGHVTLVAPERIGPYKLENLIGSGGMGEVWRGVRDDGLFDQEVAIKLMRPSRYASEALGYFDTERRALARLNHRHIARLMDGGVTETGLPWFIMDLIDGLPMQVYAAGRKPDARAAMRLMITLIEAVQYAHARLVVHADLKPSNVLITPLGEPCLVDFGIASLAAVAAEQTDSVAFPSTPAYASPQRLNGEAPTVADDIFSLGLLLHGLLSGTWPEKPVELPLPGSGHAVCDALIAKACAPDPDDRYITAQAFADDLRAVIEARPTSLQQSDWRTQGRLFVKRHPRAMLAAGSGLLATMAALAVISVLYVQAQTERDRAQKRFDDVRELAGFMLGDLHDDLVKLPGAAALKARTTAVGRDYLEKLSLEADAPVDVRRDVAIGYARVGNAEATTSTNATGHIKAGEDALKASETRLRDLIDDYPARADFRRELAQTRTWQAGVLMSARNDIKGAQSALDEAFHLYDEVLTQNPNDAAAGFGRWNAELGRADLLNMQEKYTDIIALMGASLSRYKDLPAPEAFRSQKVLLEAATQNNLGDASYYAISPEAGVAHYLEAVSVLKQAQAAGLKDVRIPLRLVYYHFQLSASYQDMQQPRKALSWVERGLALSDEVMRYDDSVFSERLNIMLSLQRASVLGDLGRTREALRAAEQSVQRSRIRSAQAPDDIDRRIGLGSGLHTLAKYYVRAGLPAKACAASKDSLNIFNALSQKSLLPERNRTLDVVPLADFVATCPR
jgi:eukaryotic-like serine/threonine-protein kinase